MKIVINKCYGGYGLSPLGKKRFAELSGRKCFFFKRDYKNDTYKLLTEEQAIKDQYCYAFDVDDPSIFAKNWGNHFINDPEDRSDPKLIQVVEELGAKANGAHANLIIVKIPDGIKYYIDDYDGVESIHEEHSSWG